MTETAWQYKNPEFLWLLLVIPIYLIFKYWYARKNSNALALPSSTPFARKISFVDLFAYTLPLFRALFMACLIFALARPQVPIAETDVSNKNGLDVILCLDVSYSMLARDFSPNRIGALKEKSKEYINKVSTDRVGIVAYSDEALMKMPLTFDKEMLNNTIDDLNTNELAPGTDIGLGLLTAINHIKDSKAKSKVIILMSDGEHQAMGNNDPLLAADIAKSKDIKIYTIGIGKTGLVTMPSVQQDMFGNIDIQYGQGVSNLDEGLLQNIATITEGKYYRATSKQGLQEIYDDIDKLEKSEIGTPPKSIGFKELYEPYLKWAIILLCIELILRTIVYKSA